ncbi:MAG: alpha/beta hydrolase [Ferruginibacter sp.]
MKTILLIVIATLSLTMGHSQQKAFSVEIKGKGQPIILIPGYSCSGDVWKETVQHLAGNYECHVLTLAGFAGVPAIDTPILQTVRDEIINYTMRNKLNKPMIIGHSLGSFMGLWVSSTAPELFGKLICVDGMPFLSALGNPAANADSLKKNPIYNPESVVKNFENLPDAGFIDNTAKAMLYQVTDTARARQIATWQYLSNRKTLGLTLIELATTDLRKDIAKIQQPILVLGSKYSTKEISYKLIGEQFTNAKQATIDVADSKHFIMYDQPEWFYSKIDTFLK